jgi:xanthine dehydrogenase accessory factor
MTMTDSAGIFDLASTLHAKGEAYALATVVRTVAATPAKAGAKALIRPDGTISEGWIGGGCAKMAVLKAAKEAIADGKPRLVSVQPVDLLDDLGVKAGEEKDGVRFAKNLCPSKGTIDVFVEPVLPKPELVICGSSPIAVALADLGPRLGFQATICAPREEQQAFSHADRRIEGYALEAGKSGQRYVIVATQGKGDEAALRAALASRCDYVAFVGSRKKIAALRGHLAEGGVAEDQFSVLKAPAGLDIGAITPEEIALSILAEIVERRRQGGRLIACQPSPA